MEWLVGWKQDLAIAKIENIRNGEPLHFVFWAQKWGSNGEE
jgi:hypothetical protein